MKFRRVRPVSGPSSYRIALVGRWLLGAWLILGLAVPGVLIARRTIPSENFLGIFFIVLDAWIGCSCLMGLAIAYVQVQMRRERGAGFSWPQEQFRNLDQIDPVSLVVIREAGEELLSKAQRQARIIEARKWASENPVNV